MTGVTVIKIIDLFLYESPPAGAPVNRLGGEINR